MRTLLLLPAIVLATGCAARAAPSTPPSADQLAVTRAAVAYLRTMYPADSFSTMVAKDGSAEYAMLAAVGAATPLSRVARTDAYDLPPAHVRLDSVLVAGDSARVVAWLGPIRRQRPGIIMMGCGRGQRLTFVRNGAGAWVPGRYQSTVLC